MVNVSIDARRNRSDESPITQEQRDKVQKSSNEAYVIVRKGYGVLDKILDQSGRPSERRRKRREAWMNNTEVKRWFGTDHLSYYQIKQLTDRLSSLKSKLEGTVTFTIIQHQDGTRSWLCNDGSHPNWAYTGVSTPIKLCPEFFYRSDRERAHTVVHELCHNIGLTDKWHSGAKVYGYNDAKSFATINPRQARRNPSNIEYFCDEYYPVPPVPDPYRSVLKELVNRFKETHPEAEFSYQHPTKRSVSLQLGQHSIRSLHCDWVMWIGGDEKRLTVELHFEHIYEDVNEHLFNMLVPFKPELDALLDADVYFGVWGPGFYSRYRKIEIARAKYYFDSLEGQERENLINWGVESMIKLYLFALSKIPPVVEWL